VCLPKAPKQDPQIAADQAAQRQRELERLAEEKKKQLAVTRRGLTATGPRSLLSGDVGSGFGSNY